MFVTSACKQPSTNNALASFSCYSLERLKAIGFFFCETVGDVLDGFLTECIFFCQQKYLHASNSLHSKASGNTSTVACAKLCCVAVIEINAFVQLSLTVFIYRSNQHVVCLIGGFASWTPLSYRPRLSPWAVLHPYFCMLEPPCVISLTIIVLDFHVGLLLPRGPRRYDRPFTPAGLRIPCRLPAIFGHQQWHRNEFESGGGGHWSKVTVGAPIRRFAPKNFFGHAPPLFGSKHN